MSGRGGNSKADDASLSISGMFGASSSVFPENADRRSEETVSGLDGKELPSCRALRPDCRTKAVPCKQSSSCKDGSGNISRPGPGGKKRSCLSPVSFRPTDAEREQLKRDAGDMSQSAYIRQCLFGNKASKRIVPEFDRILLAQILARLGESRIASNLNQIAYHANCGSLLLDDVTVEEIKEACLHVAWMRTQLIAALGLKGHNMNRGAST